jgi:hypothetical protein
MSDPRQELPAYCRSMLRTADDIELDAFGHGWLTPPVEAALAEFRWLAWAECSNPFTILHAVTAVYEAIHEEENSEA